MTAAANKYQETVYTSSSSASCGIDHLGEGSEYLMAGSVNEKGRLFISSCSDLRSDDINNGAGSPQEWNGMTKTQKAKLLSGGFGKSC
uniref:Lipoprotein n=1 Tax=Rhabditophanes sp. KR3021 TaxID=114890 RepID=A0AC35TIA6_9BILA